MTSESPGVPAGRVPAPPSHPAGRQLALLAIAEVLTMTLWFSATAVLPALRTLWNLTPGQAAWLTAAVQLGFVIGALTSAFFNLPDVLPPRRMFTVAALLGAAVNLALAWWVHAPGPALVLRFCTGFCLAGVYPPGMKMAAGHVEPRRRGLAIGLLVGALTLGSATPHLLAAWAGGAQLPHRLVLSTASVLAVLGAALVALFAVDGPYLSRPVGFDIRQVGRVLHNRAMVLANLGYLGHMWELYAMWAWLAIFLATALPGRDAATPRLLAFACIGVAGCCGAVGGGWIADRIGRTTVAIGAMVISGACCLLSAVVFGAPLWILGLFCWVWGASVIADSAQFSACVTELSDPAYMGTALTLQTSLGFALTLISIWTLPQLAARAGWQFAFWMLAPGPLLGSLAMAALRRDPGAMQCAGGRL